MNEYNHKLKVRQSFNRSAFTYDQYSYPQQMIGDTLIQLILKYLSDAESIIDLGCGSGITTEHLAMALNFKYFTAIDIADELILTAKARLARHDIHIVSQDFETYALERPLYNLVFSNMSLQWSYNFRRLFTNIRQNLITDGMLAFSIPVDGTFIELPVETRNSFSTIAEVKATLMHAGFELIESQQQLLTFGFNSWYGALKSIKATGANYLIKRSTKSLSNRNVLTKNDESDMISSDGARLTYNIGYFIARKKSHDI